MTQDRDSLKFIGVSTAITAGVLLIYHYLLILNMVQIHNAMLREVIYKAVYKICQKNNIYIVRAVIPLAIIATTVFQKYEKKKKYSKAVLYVTPLLLIFYFMGFSNNFYGRYLYPFVFFLTIIFLPMACSFFVFTTKETDKPLGVNTKHDKEAIKYDTEKGPFYIPNPNAGTWCEGGAGCGKTLSNIIPALIEFIKQGRAGVLYDLEGDLKQENGALLSRIAYRELVKQNSQDKFSFWKLKRKNKVRFAFFNMTDLARTVKVNPISPKYIKSYTQALEISSAIMLNLNKEWAEPSQRFWGENGINAFAGTIWHFVTKKPEMATIPHVVEFLTRDFKNAMLILAQDNDVLPYIRPVLAPFLKQGAGGQASGAESTTQFSMGKLRSKESYYVLSPKKGEEMPLDITNKKDPVILCLGSNKPLEIATIPILGSILQVCRMNMNCAGKKDSFFMIDELPTIYIDQLERLPAEARKHGVATFLALQTFAQLEESYGNKKARIIQDNCANLFIGKTSTESAERIVKAMGEYKKEEFSHSYSESSNNISIREQYDKIVRVNDITGQPRGHFTGMIGGGEPPYFSLQLKKGECEPMDIPAFNKEMMSHGKEKEESEIDQIVTDNFNRIISDIDQYISTYMNKN